MAKTIGDIVEVNVTLLATNRLYRAKPFLPIPLKDEKNNIVTGWETLSAADQKKCADVLGVPSNGSIEDVSFVINHGDVLKLQKNEKTNSYVIDRAYALYLFYKTITEVVSSEKDKTAETFFIMNNHEEHAIEKLSVGKARAKAYANMNTKVTMSDRADLLYFFGENPKNYSNSRMESYLYDKCMSDPDAINNYFAKQDENKQIVFVKKLLSYGLIKKEGNGYLQYGSITLGPNIESAAAFLYDDKNSAVYEPLLDALNEKEGIK